MTTLLERLLAANTLALMPRCAGYWHKDDHGGPCRDQWCSRAATYRLAHPERNYGIYGLRCEAHSDIDQVDREHLQPLPQRSQVLDLERIAWSSK